jgi:hypothetical protein
MAEADIAGDQATLEMHLRQTAFLAGVEEGRWQILAYQFPYLEVRVTATTFDGFEHSMEFRLECAGYPAIGPFIERWDATAGLRPAAPDPSVTAPSVADALKDWNETGTGHGGIYRAWSRDAARHNNWATTRPELAWHPRRTLTFLMEELHALVAEQAFWLDWRTAA